MMLLGNRGQRQDLLIVVGATFGPRPVSLISRGTPIDATGCSLHAQARRNPRDAEPLFSFDCVLVDPTARPQFLLGLPASASAGVETGVDSRDPHSHAWWNMVLRDSTARIIPLAWGTVTLVRDATHVVI